MARFRVHLSDGAIRTVDATNADVARDRFKADGVSKVKLVRGEASPAEIEARFKASSRRHCFVTVGLLLIPTALVLLSCPPVQAADFDGPHLDLGWAEYALLALGAFSLIAAFWPDRKRRRPDPHEDADGDASTWGRRDRS